MGVPTETELNEAIKIAALMREKGKDDHFLAKTLLNHHHQLGLLLKVKEAAKHYLHSGHGTREHSALLKAIQEAEDAAKRTSGKTNFGLE